MKWSIKDNEIFKSFKENKSLKLTGQLCLLFLIFSLSLFLFTFRKLPPQIPLFYSLPWGEQQLAPTFSLLLLPLGFFFIILLNFFLIAAYLRNYLLAAKILIWLNISLIFLTSLNLIKITLLIY